MLWALKKNCLNEIRKIIKVLTKKIYAVQLNLEKLNLQLFEILTNMK